MGGLTTDTDDIVDGANQILARFFHGLAVRHGLVWRKFLVDT